LPSWKGCISEAHAGRGIWPGLVIDPNFFCIHPRPSVRKHENDSCVSLIHSPTTCPPPPLGRCAHCVDEADGGGLGYVTQSSQALSPGRWLAVEQQD
jgi:hypothetical protein